MGKNQKEIFKYYRLNDHLIDNLKNNRIYASSREELNDPFDILSFVKVDGRKTGYRTMISAVKKAYNISFDNIEETNEILHKVIKENKIDLKSLLKDKNIDIDPNDYFKYLAGKMKVVSFTNSKESNLMWAHYADAFKGVMVKYLIYPNKDEYEEKVAMKYEKKIQESDSLEDIIHYIFGYKLKDWEYEQELRVVIDRENEKEKEKAYFQNIKLKEVYLGAKFYKNEPQKINEFKAEILKSPDIRLYKSFLDEINYKLNYKEISINDIGLPL